MIKYEDLIMFLNNNSEKIVWWNTGLTPWLNQYCLLSFLCLQNLRENLYFIWYAYKQVLLYFFAVAHWNYAGDWVAYLRMMKHLPNNLPDPFMEGEHGHLFT